MTPTYLLDASVLIPLIAAEHVHHERATAWAAEVDRFALCPIVEGALVRFVVRLGGRSADAQSALAAVRNRPGYDFWADDVSYADVELGHVQATDRSPTPISSRWSADAPDPGWPRSTKRWCARRHD